LREEPEGRDSRRPRARIKSTGTPKGETQGGGGRKKEVNLNNTPRTRKKEQRAENLRKKNLEKRQNDGKEKPLEGGLKKKQDKKEKTQPLNPDKKEKERPPQKKKGVKKEGCKRKPRKKKTG